MIVELQARREYEGFGEFPSFTGYDYEQYRHRLEDCKYLVGISVWCQTGGWSRFRKISFLSSSSVWNEINAFVTIRIFRDRMSAEDAVGDYCRRYLPGRCPDALVRLLSHSDTLVKELWYLPEFSEQRLYFRRVRVPPLIWVFWDTIIVNHTLRKILRRFVHRRREAIRDGYRTLYHVRAMRELAGELGLDPAPFDYQYTTFRIIAMSREYFLGHWSPELGQAFHDAAAAYRSTYPDGFIIECDFSPVRVKKQVVKAVFQICLRPQPAYRLIDRVLLVRLTGLLYPLVKWWERRRWPEFTQKQAMGVQVLFK